MTKEQIKEHVDELLVYEEEHDVLWLTTREERREFQQGVQALFDAEHELIDKVLEIIDQMGRENMECNDDPAKTILQIEHHNFRALVMELKGGEQG